MIPRSRLRRASLLLSLVSSSAWVQNAAEGTIRGYVHDNQGGVLPGVVLTVTSPAAATPSTAVTDGQGFYRLLGLTPGEYLLTASLPGFAKYERAGIEVRAEVNIQVDVTLELGKVDETIVVALDTPMLEVQKTTQSINISGEFMKLLPLSSRRVWQDALDLTPGIMSRSLDRAGAPVHFLRGTENENHVVQIDGADAGSFRLNFPGFFLGLSSEAVSDVQIKTAGIDAAAPLAEGMVINIATPSGTNQLRGSLAAVYTARGWNGNNTPGARPSRWRRYSPTARSADRS